MKNYTELCEYQESTEKHFRKAVRSIKEQFTISKTLERQIDTIESYFETYEIMYDVLIKVREVSSTAMKSNDLTTIEREYKYLYDTFWN